MGRGLHFGQTELESISMITIRKATTGDCDVILQWENNPLLWEVTDEPGPFTKEDISTFLLEQNSIKTANQERWIIENCLEPIGMVDLFQWDPDQRSVGIGIALPNIESRKKGFATEALKIVHSTMKMKYGVQHFHCIIHTNNPASQKLFEKLGYQKMQSENHRDQKVYRYRKSLEL
jgi:diamine N-acetyltransferase